MTLLSFMQLPSEQISRIRHAKLRRLSKVSAAVSVDRRPLTRSIFACIHGGSCVTPIVAFLASVAPMNMHCTAARNLQPHWRNDGARDKEAIWLSSMEMSLSVWMDRCEVPECRKNQMMLQNDTFMLQTSDQGVSIYESFILQNETSGLWPNKMMHGW